MRRLMLLSWLGSSGNIRSNILLTRGDLRRRKWLFMCFVRMILPVPVILKRLAAPLWVFILGMETSTPVSNNNCECGLSLRPALQVTVGNYNTSEGKVQARL